MVVYGSICVVKVGSSTKCAVLCSATTDSRYTGCSCMCFVVLRNEGLPVFPTRLSG